MQFPSLKSGQRLAQDVADAPADAYYLARLAQQQAQSGHALLVVCEHAHDAQRLQVEMAFFDPALRLALLPDWETLPYDLFSPHQDLISERLATLWRLVRRQVDVVLVWASTVLQRIAPPAFLAAWTFDFQQGQKLDVASLREQLVQAGYSHVGNVLSPGEYAIRGSLIDLYPMGAASPLRLDLLDDEIDSIRAFDPDSQRSLYPVSSVHLLPGREFPMDEAARTAFRQRWREHIEGDPNKSRIYQDIGNGIASPGIEYWLPLFFDETALLLDYFKSDDLLVLQGALDTAMQAFMRDAQERYRIAVTHERVLEPLALYANAEQFFQRASKFARLQLKRGSTPDWVQPLPVVAAQRDAAQPLARLRAHVQHCAAQGIRSLLVLESEGRRESLRDMLQHSGLSVQLVESLAAWLTPEVGANAPDMDCIGLAVGGLSAGCALRDDLQLDILTETELFASTPHMRRKKRQEQTSDIQALVHDLSELRAGDPVVHAQHGIARYRGLVTLDVQSDGEMTEFLHLEYAQQALLYVPVSQLHLISRYSGVNAENAPLHKLGSNQWDKARRKAAEQVRDTAAELLAIYASRAAKSGHAFRLDAQSYDDFVADFGFEETPDQKAAIEHVMQDLIAPKPMDRLVCGDVGFGKTEVALRAAFVAVMGGKQVAMLAPTTLLAEQHFQTLKDRFSRWPVRIAEMSRFRSPKEIKEACAGLQSGSIDIVVGTHKLLSPAMRFKDLGLLIIDEEHRFGVRHKETMKAMRADVDVLTLTATPIPRTMGMALEGLRDLSVIATAPQRRLAIKTLVRSENNSVMREALMRELKRGGQCYFLHNDVASIDARLQRLQALVPEARIGVAHGQMPERELERVMRDFVAQRYHILLCSTIIETGIDVPSANTILISRADRFGLAQLHQLRGRVGRSHHQAYAYLMVQDVPSLTLAAQQRLEAIARMEELGSGFYLAMHDLEIRGAGEVLGDNQSGNLHEVGFQLYSEMLEAAVTALRQGTEPDLLQLRQQHSEIHMHAPALLPNDFCPDVALRLSFYKKLASAKSQTQLHQIQEELADRFGKLPPAVRHLLDSHRLRLWGEPLAVQRIDALPHVLLVRFAENSPVDPQAIVRLLHSNRAVKLAGNHHLRIERALPEVSARVQFLRDLLQGLRPSATTAPQSVNFIRSSV